jgi:hypothetical protein
MRLKKLQNLVKCQKANGNKNCVYLMGIGEQMTSLMKNRLYDNYKVWCVHPKHRDYIRVAGLELHTIYVDEISKIDEDAMEYLLTRVRWPKGETGIPITKLTTEGVDIE